MDQRERFYDPWEASLAGQDATRSRIHTAFPGVITAWNPGAMTCQVQPVIQYQVRQGQGWVWTRLPLLVDCPVHFPAGGGVTMTFPIKSGDECLVVIAERCIDAWWQSGPGSGYGGQIQAELRMHNLSDGFVIPKVWSQPNKIPSISTNSAQLRTTDGQNYVEVKEDGNINVVTTQNVTVTATQNVTVNAQNISLNAQQGVTITAGSQIKMSAPIIYEN